jgi:hypothetical protein
MSLIQDLAGIALSAILFGPPIAAAAREVKRGGNGLRSAMIVGAIVWPGFGFVSLLVEFFRDPRIGWVRDNMDWFAVALAMSAVGGAAIGLLEGIAYCFIRALTRLPRTLRVRAERSANSNWNGSPTGDARYETHLKQDHMAMWGEKCEP